MRIPLSWLRDYVELPAELDPHDLARRLVQLGLEVERVEQPGGDVAGAVVVGRVADFTEETHSNGKTIRWCHVDVGEAEARGIVCGAANFDREDLVVVALPGATLPGGFAIGARATYGHVSDGMICSARELGLGDEHTGIMVLGADEAKPGDDAAELLGLRERVLEIAVTPDRGYALSLRGIAREAAAAYGLAFDDPASRPLPPLDAPGHPVQIRDSRRCSSFVALSVDGFDPSAPSPGWLRRRLELAGMRTISLPVDVTNYVMLELGQPLHGYDADRLSGPIVVRPAEPGERLTTLDGSTRSLDPDDLLIADESGPIGLAGVMGGAATELDHTSRRVVVEAAHFDPVTVARTARQHRLPSEAAKRFERGVDPALPLAAAHRAAQLLSELGHGRLGGATVAGHGALPAQRIELRPELVGRLLGTPVPEADVAGALRIVGCEVEPAAGSRLAVRPPSWRPDLQGPYDLVEEAARLRGYDTIPSVLPQAPAGRGLTPAHRRRRLVGYSLAGAGFTEVLSHPFVGPADWTALGIDADDPRRHTLRVANPLSDEEPELRTTLLPGLLRAVARNVGRGHADLAVFESGLVYLPAPTPGKAPRPGVDRPPTARELAALQAALPDQPRHLAVVLSGDRSPASWWGPARAATWADAVAAVQRVADTLGVAVRPIPDSRSPWHPGRCARMVLDEVSVGFAGELHPAVCHAYRIPACSCAAEIDLDALIDSAPAIRPAPRLSNHPVAKEDVALVVDRDVSAGDVEAALRAGAGELLESVRLFDVYTGHQVPAGAKSLAFALRFRAPDRTLTEAEARAARDSAVAAAATAVGAVVRR